MAGGILTLGGWEAKKNLPETREMFMKLKVVKNASAE